MKKYIVLSRLKDSAHIALLRNLLFDSQKSAKQQVEFERCKYEALKKVSKEFWGGDNNGVPFPNTIIVELEIPKDFCY